MKHILQHVLNVSILRILAFLLLPMGVQAQLPYQLEDMQTSNDKGGLEKMSSFPFPRMNYWMDISSTLHPKLGAQACSLGDVNLDGFNDLAISTFTDTTFIWFGGPNFTGHEPDMWVLGGSNGIVAGDFNGDGYIDIVTSGSQAGLKRDGRDAGRLWFYLHNKTVGAYDSVPTLSFVGYKPGLNLGQKIYGADINGDGKLDILAWHQEVDIGTGKEYVYFGKSKPDSLYDAIINEVIPPTLGSAIKDSFGEYFFLRDMNSDSRPYSFKSRKTWQGLLL